MVALYLITTSRKSRLCTLYCDCVVERCRFSWRLWLERRSPSMWSQMTRFRMWRRRSRIKRESPRSNSVWFLLVNNWRTDELSRIITSKRNPLCIWCCDCVVVRCKFSWRRWLERPLRWMWNPMTRFKMSRRRFRIKRESHLSNSDWFSQESSWRMDVLYRITTSKRNRLCIWCCDCVVVRCRFSWRLWPERRLLWMLNRMIRFKMWRPRSRIKRESHLSSNVSFSPESNWKMDVLCPIITFKRSLPFTWCSDYVVVQCKSSWKRWPERLSPSMWSQMTRFKM